MAVVAGVVFLAVRAMLVAPTSAGWRRCVGPAMPTGSTPITGPSPTDLPRGQAYDLARDRANIRISILSPTGLDGQIGHDDATLLDRELAWPSRTTLANIGFGREVTEAKETPQAEPREHGPHRPAGGRPYPCVQGFCRQSGAYGSDPCRQGHGRRTRTDVHRRQD